MRYTNRPTTYCYNNDRPATYVLSDQSKLLVIRSFFEENKLDWILDSKLELKGQFYGEKS